MLVWLMERILFVSSVRYDMRCALVTLLFACLDGWNICCLLSKMVGIFVVCLVRWLEYLLFAWLDGWTIFCRLGSMVGIFVVCLVRWLEYLLYA